MRGDKLTEFYNEKFPPTEYLFYWGRGIFYFLEI